MTGREREARRLRLLVARLRDDWRVVERIHGRLRTAIDRIESEGADDVTVGAAALYLQNIFTAVDELLQRAATELDGTLPEGADWHRELLDQMSVEIPDVRPRVLDEELHGDLDLLCRFRHRTRHAYAEALDWDEMGDAVVAEARVLGEFPRALEQLVAFLERTVAALESSPG